MKFVFHFALIAASVSSVLCGCSAAQNVELHPLTPAEIIATSFEDGMLKTRSAQFWGVTLEWIPRGDGLLVSRPARDGNAATVSHLDIGSGTEKLLVEGGRSKFSLDGSLFGYSDSDGNIIIGRISAGSFNQSAEIETRPEGGSASIARSPSHFAFSRDNQKVAYLKYQDFAPSSGYEGDPVYGLEAMSPEIWVRDLTSGEEVLLFSPPLPAKPVNAIDLVNIQLGSLAYGPDDVLFFTQGFGSFYAGMDTHLYAQKAGEAPVLVSEDVENYNVFLDLNVSPDGSGLLGAFSATPDFVTYGAMGGRAIVDTTTGERTNFHSGPYSGSVGAKWAPDSSAVYFRCKPGAFAGTICRGDATSGEIAELTVLETRANISSIAVSPDGEQVAWMSWDREDNIRLKVRDIAGGQERVLWEDPSPVSLKHRALGEERLVRWTSFDGLAFEGVLILPVGYEEGDQVPLMVDIHGGAAGGVRIPGSLLNSSPLEHQMWAGMGYAVFLADYRKGIVASNHIEAVRRVEGMSFHQGDAADVIAGIEHIIDLGVADPDRIVAIGHSYGSTVLNQLIAQSDILALAISKEGTHDFSEFIRGLDKETQPASYETALYMWRATPETLQSLADQSSPLLYAHQIKTPLLLIKAGSNTPERIEMQRKAADEFVGAINETGGMAHSLFFADDYHVIAREENVREMLGVTLEWMERYASASPNTRPSK